MAARLKMAPDTTQVEQVYASGIVRDVARHLIPPGGIYNAVDFLLERPGVAYKRGGWEYHSYSGSGADIADAVATIHIPTRVVSVTGGKLYDNTSEGGPQNEEIDDCFAPSENPPLYLDRLIFCDPTATDPPLKVYWDDGGSTMAVANLGGSPPAAAHSTVYASRIVLGRGDNSAADVPYNRIWFSPLPDVESTWDTSNAYLDVTSEIMGFAPVQGVLLVFAPTSYERIIGGVPPSVEGENMQLQPVDGGVGCLDARSIVHIEGGEVVFAGEMGVYATNGGAPRSLTEKADRSGIQNYWRSLFPSGEVRQVIGGLLARDFYIVSILDADDDEVDSLMCHLPTLCWTRLSNIRAKMFANGRTENETMELYAATGSAEQGNAVIARMMPLLSPTADNKGDMAGIIEGNDAGQIPVEPVLELRPFGGGTGLKAYGHGRAVYDMSRVESDVWETAHVYQIVDRIVANDQIFEVTARTGDFKSGAVEPTWANASDVNDSIVDNHVTWTNRGPQLIVYTARGIEAETFTERKRLYLTDMVERERFDVNLDSESVTVRLVQSGGSAQTEVMAVEVEARPYDLASEGV